MKRSHGKVNTRTTPIIQKVNNLNVKEIKIYFGLAPNGSK